MRLVPGRRFAVVLAAIMLAGAVLRLGWIVSQAPTVDDAEVAWTAVNYVLHGQPMPTMPFHPPFRNLLVYVSTWLFGGSVLGVKGFSLLFGVLLIGVTGLFVRRVVRDDRAGMWAAGLVALDVVMIDYSRQAIQEVHVAFFIVLGAWLAVEALRAESTREWRWLVPLAGLSFGLGVASKFYALAPMALAAGLLLADARRRKAGAEALLVGASLGPLPFLTYLLTWTPWFGRGYSLAEWLRFQGAIVEAMVTHTRPPVAFMAFNRPALWFLAPFYGFVDVAMAQAGPQVIIAVGNPLVWLAMLPAVAYSLLTPAQRRRDALLLAFFAVTYAPLALSPRPVWLLSSVAVFPFAAGVLGSVVSGLSRRFGPRVAWAYGSLVLVTSLLLYPLAIGRSLDVPYLQPVVSRMGDYMAVGTGAGGQ